MVRLLLMVYHVFSHMLVPKGRLLEVCGLKQSFKEIKQNHVKEYFNITVGFLEGRKTNEAIGVPQEAVMHRLKTRKEKKCHHQNRYVQGM